MTSNIFQEPWKSFLRELDELLLDPTELHCLGAFVASHVYELPRATADVDVVHVLGTDPAALVKLAGKGSPLHKSHNVYLDIVTVASLPENYDARLIDMPSEGCRNLRLRGLERHDLMLAKLERNSDRDREDLMRIAEGPGLDPALLRDRYDKELRPILGNPQREDLTLALWIEIIEEVNAPRENGG